MKPMLAKDANLAKLTFPVIVQPKLDGIRCLIKDGRPVSRTLKPIPNKEIHDALSDPRLEGLDGELIVGEPTADGCMQRTTSFVMAPNKTGEPWQFWAFDSILNPEQPYWSQEPVAARWKTVFWTCFGLTGDVARKVTYVNSGPNSLVRQKRGWTREQTMQDLLALEEAYVREGWEGVIVRVPDAPYKFGRSGVAGPLLKIKRFTDFEAEIIGVYEEQANLNTPTKDAFGRTERSSRAAGKVGKWSLGGFVLKAVNGPWEGVQFRCGTGFDAEQRSELWKNRLWMPGKIVKVKAFEVGAKDKPRFPTFLGFRDMEVDG